LCTQYKTPLYVRSLGFFFRQAGLFSVKWHAEQTQPVEKKF